MKVEFLSKFDKDLDDINQPSIHKATLELIQKVDELPILAKYLTSKNFLALKMLIVFE